jgi:hypothetical protein
MPAAPGVFFPHLKGGKMEIGTVAEGDGAQKLRPVARPKPTLELA